MLVSLHIENIAVIKNVDIDMTHGFAVLTGETGAGKSKIIDSISLIMGGKASKDLVRNGESSAMVSALFTDIDRTALEELAELGVHPDEEGNIYIQRNLSSEGKSVSRINGRTVPQSLHREVGRLLINVHGQHDNQMLLSPSSHINILDSYGSDPELLSRYRAVYQKMCDTKSRISALMLDEREKQQRIDMLEYQIADIESASLKSGEDESLESELKLLKNVKQLSKSVTTIYRALYKNEKGMSASKLVDIARSSLEDISESYPEGLEHSARLLDIQYELEDIAGSVMTVLQGVDENPERRISEIEDRLDIIRKLKRKYGATVDEVLDFYNNASRELESIMLSDTLVSQLEKELGGYKKEACTLASQISKARRESAVTLSEKICSELAYLDMNKVRFKVEISREREDNGDDKLNQNGFDNVEFMITTNPGEPFRPLARIASGGELSRIMLAIKCVLSDAEGIATVIFDEIDTGVSGKTAQKIGVKLAQLGRTLQVICITHSAQVASVADSHYKITKDIIGERAETHVTLLEKEERVTEIARIMGGVNITDAVLKSAHELLEYKN